MFERLGCCDRLIETSGPCSPIRSSGDLPIVNNVGGIVIGSDIVIVRTSIRGRSVSQREHWASNAGTVRIAIRLACGDTLGGRITAAIWMSDDVRYFEGTLRGRIDSLWRRWIEWKEPDTSSIDFVTYVYVAAAEQNIDGWYWIKSAVLRVK